MTRNDTIQEFGQRYQIENIDISTETMYTQLPISFGSYADVNLSHTDVRMVTLKMPLDKLDELIDDLEMKNDEIRMRRTIPALHDLYQKYRMTLELYK